MSASAQRRGALAGLAAAALFGLSAPLAKRLLADVGPLHLAGLLYLGAGLGLTAVRLVRPASREAPLRRVDLGLLLGIVLAGGVLGPVLLLVGLRHLAAVSASLLLNLEGLFTLALAVLVFREHVSWRTGGAALAILLGATFLAWRPGEVRVELTGVLCVAGACAAWGLDNNLTCRLSLRDPVAIVQVKALVAGGCNLFLGLAVGERATLTPALIGASLVVGLLGYGLSIVLDVYSLRLIGAAREAAYFATAPFVGAVAAVPLLGERLYLPDAIAAALMAVGVVFLLKERHSHLHVHEPMEHDHLHVHDEHHQHEHAPGQDAAGPHAHPHRHETLTHEHRHVPDLHHRHKHGSEPDG
jgi:drug/metabolite transporter (DMT)-like permease